MTQPSEIWQRGEEACERGDGKDYNPWPVGSDDWHSWEAGWEQAEENMKDRINR